MEEIIVGSDHAGFVLKEAIKPSLFARGLTVIDAGTHDESPVDYPDIGAVVAERVVSGEFARGILICGSGVGMSIVANRYHGARAALCLDEETALLSRLHNDSNILVLAGRRTATERAWAILDVWLRTPFSGERHESRLDKIRDLEAALCRKYSIP
ncbi:MAG: ribose 5-phosphate isomerase B [Deltaproteobacteria bacterium]|nr:ribose 5-phosphate isomerase B [Deltaproteobacteria bacterium]